MKKVCKNCKLEKSDTAFRCRSNKSKTLRTICKECEKLAAKIRDQLPEQKEKRRAYNAKYLARPRTKVLLNRMHLRYKLKKAIDTDGYNSFRAERFRTLLAQAEAEVQRHDRR